MSAPNTRLWSARENKHRPSGWHLVVGGQVEVSDVNKAPVLTEAPSVGKVLGLDLTIMDTGGMGIQTPVWKAAYLHKEVSAHQYDSVEIRFDGSTIATAPVIDDREHGKLAAKQAELQNKTQVPLRQPAKKAVAKVRKAVKTAAKVVKKAVKKAAKKLVSKAKKTAAGKSAKKKAAKSAARKPARKAARAAPRKKSKAKKGRR